MPFYTSPSPFTKVTQNSDNEGYPIKEIFGKKAVEGQVGLEIEVEGNFFPKSLGYHDPDHGEDVMPHEIPSEWDFTHDGSLRGDDNAEYILVKPLNFNEVPSAVDNLWAMFDRVGSKLDESNRTSIHVHLNVLDWHLPRLCSFVSMYYIVEDVLTHWCGDHRVGNLFCLRAKDAPGLVSRVRRFFKTGNPRRYFNSGMHYSGLNLLALQKLGSVEIRTMRGTTDPEVLKTWVAVLQHIYEQSANYPDPRDIVEGFSGQPRENFVRDILGPFTDKIRSECGMSSYEFNKSLHEGVRLAQQVSYSRDWSKYEIKETSYDPFKRKKRSLSNVEPVIDGNEMMQEATTSGSSPQDIPEFTWE